MSWYSHSSLSAHLPDIPDHSSAAPYALVLQSFLDPEADLVTFVLLLPMVPNMTELGPALSKITKNV